MLDHFSIPTSTVIAGLAAKMRLKTPRDKKVITKNTKEGFNQPTEEELKSESNKREMNIYNRKTT